MNIFFKCFCSEESPNGVVYEWICCRRLRYRVRIVNKKIRVVGWMISLLTFFHPFKFVIIKWDQQNATILTQSQQIQLKFVARPLRVFRYPEEITWRLGLFRENLFLEGIVATGLYNIPMNEENDPIKQCPIRLKC